MTPVEADLVVCVTDESPGYFPDEVHTTCADCGVGIHHRPFVPEQAPKVCLACANCRVDPHARTKVEKGSDGSTIMKSIRKEVT
jgi:hypothetical protein